MAFNNIRLSSIRTQKYLFFYTDMFILPKFDWLANNAMRARIFFSGVNIYI